jgi:WD40 repeat protein
VSPDGQWLAYASDDRIFVSRVDGSSVRQLTTEGTSRGPRWSPDGSTIAFYASRAGSLQIWTIEPDGSGLRQVTDQPDTVGLYFPVWSRDGRMITASSFEGRSFIIDVTRPWKEQTPASLPPLTEAGTSFVAWAWNQAGTKLAGWQLRADGSFAGVLIYDQSTGRYSRVTDFGAYPAWVGDARLLFSSNGKLFITEVEGGEPRELAIPPDFANEFSLSRDRQWMYYSENLREGDVWLISRKATR